MGRQRSLIIVEDGDLIVERDPQRPSGRLLRQGGMDASYVDLADPRHLEFDYLRWMRLLLRALRARRVLHVGGAACVLARALLAEDGGSRQEVLEVDRRVLEVARAHLGLRRHRGLRVRVADGRAGLLTRSGGDIDAVVIDAFVGARVPRHLVTAEALVECARVAPLAVVNVVDTAGLRDTRAVAAALGDAYPHVAAFSGGSRRGGNVVLFASVREPPYHQLEAAAAADPSPARLLRADELAGAVAWRDEPACRPTGSRANAGPPRAASRCARSRDCSDGPRRS